MENRAVRHKAIPIRPGEILSQAAVDHHLFEARRLRAERFGEFGRSIGLGLKRSAKRLASAFGRWQRRRIAYRELNALEDRTLQDIGLTRGQIPSVIDGLIDIGSFRRPESKDPDQNKLIKTEGADARRRQGTRKENTSVFDRRGTPAAAMQQRPNRTSYSGQGPKVGSTLETCTVGQVSGEANAEAANRHEPRDAA